MDLLIDFLKGFNIQEILCVFGIVWILTNKKFKKIEDDHKELRAEMKSLSQILIRLEGRFEERGNWHALAKRIGEEEH